MHGAGLEHAQGGDPFQTGGHHARAAGHQPEAASPHCHHLGPQLTSRRPADAPQQLCPDQRQAATDPQSGKAQFLVYMCHIRFLCCIGSCMHHHQSPAYTSRNAGWLWLLWASDMLQCDCPRCSTLSGPFGACLACQLCV
jgi:hypothetical protein